MWLVPISCEWSLCLLIGHCVCWVVTVSFEWSLSFERSQCLVSGHCVFWVVTVSPDWSRCLVIAIVHGVALVSTDSLPHLRQRQHHPSPWQPLRHAQCLRDRGAAQLQTLRAGHQHVASAWPMGWQHSSQAANGWTAQQPMGGQHGCHGEGPGPRSARRCLGLEVKVFTIQSPWQLTASLVCGRSPDRTPVGWDFETAARGGRASRGLPTVPPLSMALCHLNKIKKTSFRQKVYQSLQLLSRSCSV